MCPVTGRTCSTNCEWTHVLWCKDVGRENFQLLFIKCYDCAIAGALGWTTQFNLSLKCLLLAQLFLIRKHFHFFLSFISTFVWPQCLTVHYGQQLKTSAFFLLKKNKSFCVEINGMMSESWGYICKRSILVYVFLCAKNACNLIYNIYIYTFV